MPKAGFLSEGLSSDDERSASDVRAIFKSATGGESNEGSRHEELHDSSVTGFTASTIALPSQNGITIRQTVRTWPFCAGSLLFLIVSDLQVRLASFLKPSLVFESTRDLLCGNSRTMDQQAERALSRVPVTESSKIPIGK
jgi:hypothetical protein